MVHGWSLPRCPGALNRAWARGAGWTCWPWAETPGPSLSVGLPRSLFHGSGRPKMNPGPREAVGPMKYV